MFNKIFTNKKIFFHAIPKVGGITFGSKYLVEFLKGQYFSIQ